MKKKSILKKLLYLFGSIAIILSIGIWIFLTFYFQETLNKALIPKIEQAVLQATHGKFTLSLGSITYKNSTLIGNTFVLSRAAYDSSECGMVLDRVTIDSVRFEGVNWWDILRLNDLRLTTFQLNAPKVYMATIDSIKAFEQNTHFDTAKKVAAALPELPLISFDSIILHDACVFLPIALEKSTGEEYRNITIKLTDFLLDPKSTKPQSPFFSKRIDFMLPEASYAVDDSIYSIEVHGIRGSFSDSLITIDSFAYKSNYSEEAYTDMYPYIQSRLEFGCAGITMRKIDFSTLLKGDGLRIQAIAATSWYVNYYGDLRKPHDPHPPDAILPHTILQQIKAPVLIDSLILNNGLIRHRERVAGSSQSSLITFTNTNVTASPFCTDSSCSAFNAPLQISVNALFMGQGKVSGNVIYPIHHPAFDLRINAAVGAFDLSVLNSFLITNERKEITSGKCLGGELHMDIRSGTGTTTVSPRYVNMNIKILATGAKEHRGFLEGLKTLIANMFMLRTSNIDSWNKKAISVTTTSTRSRKEEFFEFVWIALRASIRKLIG